MRVSYNWLKAYVDVPLSPQELAVALTARGVVVERVIHANPGVEGVLVGRVLQVEPHPNADHLSVCQVDIGSAQPLQMVTGAPNVRQGDLVPAAVPGSKIPGRTMTVAHFRGVESAGMLCSPDELGLAEGKDGILILPPDAALQPGMDAAMALGLDDWILDLDLTANYAAHCQSLIGVAYEVAAIVGAEVRLPSTDTQDGPNTDAHGMIAIRIDAPDLCSRYVGRVVRGVQIGPSPAWLQQRVRAAGMRPINNIVDISNFVMMELGQPLHAFDYAKVKGQQVIVRRAAAGERLTTLDKQERILDEEVLVIADRSGAVAMAGVMGGLDSEVTDQTIDILIESAHFQNINNRRTALKMNLPSEAARRFTKGVDPSGCVRAADRAAGLMAELAGGTVLRGHVDVYARPAVPSVIVLRTERVNQHLGLCLTIERMAAHLRSLGMVVCAPADLICDLAAGYPEEKKGDDFSGRLVWTAMHQVSPVPTDGDAYRGWSKQAWAALEAAGRRLEEVQGEGVFIVVVPTRRLDIAQEVDLIEEIARCEGYDTIPTVLPVLPTARGGRTAAAEVLLRARRMLAGAGLDEALTHSLIHPRAIDRLPLPNERVYRTQIAIANPMIDSRSVLRTTLLLGLLDTLQYNVNRQIRDLGIFEISQVYWAREGERLPEEPRMLGIALLGNQSPLAWNASERPADFFVLKGIIEHLLGALDVQGWSIEPGEHPSLHPGRRARLVVEGQPCGEFGELHPRIQAAWDLPDRVYVAELSFEVLQRATRAQRAYRSVPRFPAVVRDVSFKMSQGVPVATVLAAMRGSGGTLLEDITLFDLYQGEKVSPGYRSLAYRLTYRSADRTLSDGEVEQVHGEVRKALQALGGELRS